MAKENKIGDAWVEVAYDTNKLKGQGAAIARESTGGLRSMIAAFGVGGLLTQAMSYGMGVIRNFASGFKESFGGYELAVRNLANTMNLLGETTSREIERMKNFASGIQTTTIYSDDLALKLQRQGAAMGISKDRLEEATRAAIGLAQVTDQLTPELAMQMLGKLASGQEAMLGRYGIAVSDALDKQEKYNQVMKIGTAGFHLATQNTTTLVGETERLKNAIGDLQKSGFVGEFNKAMTERTRMAIEQWTEWSNKAGTSAPVIIDTKTTGLLTKAKLEQVELLNGKLAELEASKEKLQEAMSEEAIEANRLALQEDITKQLEKQSGLVKSGAAFWEKAQMQRLEAPAMATPVFDERGEVYKTEAQKQIAKVEELRKQVEKQTTEAENITKAINELKTALTGG